MATEYIIVKERGVKGVDGNTWRLFEYTIPVGFANTITLPEEVLLSSGDYVIQITLNGLSQDGSHFTISGTTLTWTHPYLTLLEGEVLKIWYVPKN
jgi:hypothetical protein